MRRRPEGFWHEDPSYRTYTLAAMLDPVELADGHDATGLADTPPVIIEEFAQVDHHGRATWEAVVRPTPAYDPRCSCCPLLFSRVSDDREAEIGGIPGRAQYPGLVYPRAHRVRLDVGTGVCVSTEALGGSADGSGHELVIEAVDEPVDDALFKAPFGWRMRRRHGAPPSGGSPTSSAR